MKFYNRDQELALFLANDKLSEKNARFTLLTGRRRVGKTALLLEFMKNSRCLYLFVTRKSEALLCAEYQQAAAEALGLEILGQSTRFRDLFELLLKYSLKEHFTLIIDEFQDFGRVNPSIFGEIQDLWDRYESGSKMNFLVCGSMYSLLIKLFEDSREPLFGRLHSKMVLQPFNVSVIKEILGDYNPAYTPEDLLCLYMLSGGVPKYIRLLMDSGAYTRDAMLDRVVSADSVFLYDARDILTSEFGRDYTIYFSILQLIASGRTSQAGIDSIIGKNTGSYLSNLETDFGLITRKRPVFSKPDSRNIRWDLNDTYQRFWFRFIHANQSLVETGRYDRLLMLIEKDYTTFSGLALEDYFRKKLAQEGDFDVVGGYWDKKGLNEIDIVALNRTDKRAVIAEVKRNPKKISLNLLNLKLQAISPQLTGYTVDCIGLSPENM